MGGQGAATVVIAQPDPSGRELLARIVEAGGQNAVRTESTSPPDLVDTTVESSALLLVVDVTALGFADLDAVVSAFATRRYPAKVMALVDGPASAAWATSTGAAAALVRPFHRRELLVAMAELLEIEVPELPVYEPPPLEETPAAVDEVDHRVADVAIGDAEAEADEAVADEPAGVDESVADEPSEAEAEDAVEPEAEAEADSEEADVDDAEVEPEPAAEAKEEPEAELGPATSAETDLDSEDEPDEPDEPEAEAETEADEDAEAEAEPEAEPEAAAEDDEAEELVDEIESDGDFGIEFDQDRIESRRSEPLPPVDEEPNDTDETFGIVFDQDPLELSLEPSEAADIYEPEEIAPEAEAEDLEVANDIEGDEEDEAELVDEDTADVDPVQAGEDGDADAPEDGDDPVAEEEDEPEQPAERPSLDHSFTDILRMGRQL